MKSSLACKSERRRNEVRRQRFNGLDYVEVGDTQRTLTVYFLGPAPQGLTAANVRIKGGRRIRDIQVLDVKVCPQRDPEIDNCMIVTVDKPGDFSTYCLCLTDLPEELRFDPRYLCIEFTFKASCPSDLDCKAERACPPDALPEPDLDYLAKDYASFRQLIYDRLSVVMPEWKERHAPDFGVTLVELFAYVGDYLSYYQDAVATEAYLDTARQRISVRRHARLVDYFLHEGCNARVWVHVWTSSDASLPATELSFLTTFAQAPQAEDHILTWTELAGFPPNVYEVFEPLGYETGDMIALRTAHNRILFYTWGDAECCLSRGSTSATLVDGAPPEPDTPAQDGDKTGKDCKDDDEPPVDPDDGRVLDLHIGDVLIFEEVIGPKTGDPDDADPGRRHAVRLTRVEPTVDPLNDQPLLAIEWAPEDALPFPLCLSTVGPAPECKLLEDVSVARGNVVLCHHGSGKPPEDLWCVPVETVVPRCEHEGRAVDAVRQPGRFRPALGGAPLTFSEPLNPGAPARRSLLQDPRQAVPWVCLTSRPRLECGAPEEGPVSEWTSQRDLLSSGASDAHFVIEMDDRRRAWLRFGTGELGALPEAGLAFEATYRIGNGPTGNVGADKLVLAVAEQPISGVSLRPRNPLPAQGGTPPESVAEAKLFAPHAFRRVLERAVTPSDYAELAGRIAGVQRAASELRWNGSWYEVRVAVDPLGQAEACPALLRDVKKELYRFRRLGHDLAVRPAGHAPLCIVLDVCVEPGFLRGHVRAALLERFSAGSATDGSLGFFHPDRLTFGQGISLSGIVAAAQAIPGVVSAAVTKLERLGEGPNGEIAAGLLPIGPLEVARLDSDPSFPENGLIRFEMRGGR